MEFYKETKFKKTDISEIPENWEFTRLGEILALIRNGLTKKQDRGRRKYPVTRIETISEEQIDVNKIGFVENVTQEEIKNYSLIDGDILFSHINSLEHIGKTAIYQGNPPLLLHGMNLLLLRAIKSKINPWFLLYLLKLLRLKLFFSNIAKKAVNQASINQTELGRVKVPFPPRIEEQRKITSILSTVDEAIQKTNEIIQKTQELKKGMMQQLLTKGIGHKKFKQTEIGEIPEEWEVVRLEEVANRFISGGTPATSKPEYWNGNIHWMRSASIRNRAVNSGEKYITKEGLNNSATNIVPKGNILVATRVSIGKVAINTIDIAISQDLTGVVLNTNKAIPEYVYWTLSKAESKIKSFIQGSTIRGVLRKDLENLKIPLPSSLEQQKIVSILSDVDEKIEKEKQTKEQLEKLKKGLMQILLTGKLRVKAD
ncbi:MAG: restriction endonuclease subunit S [Candidatus Helarchaeota archaeon]|nr:restriction endonuclease subunit S [Candidatus Helarchaeota archaeon]